MHSGQRLDSLPVNFESPNDCFQSTRWTIVAQVKGEPDAKTREAALESLCRQYWRPLCVYVVKRGHSEEDAKDIVQDFFADILKKGLFADADPRRGKLRNFLIHALRCKLSDVHRGRSAKKRGGHLSWVPFDSGLGEISDSAKTPEEAYELQWASVLVQSCMNRLESYYTTRGKPDLFRLLSPSLLPDSKTSITDAAAELEKSDGATRVALVRMRKKFGEILLDEVTATLLPGDDPKEEVRYLLSVLSTSH